MANIAAVVSTISEATGVPKQKVNVVARRLGEAGMFPSGPRGRNAPDLDAEHISKILIGVMGLSEGYHSTVAKMPSVVEKVQNQSSKKPEIPPHFVQFVAECIQRNEFVKQIGLTAISLKFCGDNVIGVARAKTKTRVSTFGPLIFGEGTDPFPENVGLIQEVSVGVHVLEKLRELVQRGED